MPSFLRKNVVEIFMLILKKGFQTDGIKKNGRKYRQGFSLLLVLRAKKFCEFVKIVTFLFRINILSISGVNYVTTGQLSPC